MALVLAQRVMKVRSGMAQRTAWSGGRAPRSGPGPRPPYGVVWPASDAVRKTPAPVHQLPTVVRPPLAAMWPPPAGPRLPAGVVLVPSTPGPLPPAPVREARALVLAAAALVLVARALVLAAPAPVRTARAPVLVACALVRMPSAPLRFSTTPLRFSITPTTIRPMFGSHPRWRRVRGSNPKRDRTRLADVSPRPRPTLRRRRFSGRARPAKIQRSAPSPARGRGPE